MLDVASTLDVIAELFEYPAAGYREHVESAAAFIARTDSASAEHVQAFADAVRGRSLSEMEELYIQTFDLNPDACLDIGWHLFGEDYARGEFLVKLRQETVSYTHLVHLQRGGDGPMAHPHGTATLLPGSSRLHSCLLYTSRCV